MLQLPENSCSSLTEVETVCHSMFHFTRDQSHDSRSQDTEGMLTQMQEVYLQSTFDEVITKYHFSSHEVLEVVRNLLIALSSV